MAHRFHKDYNNGMDSQFSMHFGQLGWTTNPTVANQITELGKRLNEGAKNVELGSLTQDVFGAIPEQHMGEMRRVSKLTDSKLSFHAPLTDPSGFTQQGWHEHQRVLAEQEFKDVVKRVHKLDPKGNIPVNFHSSNSIPSVVWGKRKEKLTEEDIKYAKERGIPLREMREPKQAMTVVNPRTGEIKLLPREEIDWITTDQKILTPDERLMMLNRTNWDQQRLAFMSYKKQKDEIDAMQHNWRVRSPKGQKLLELETRASMLGGESKLPENERKLLYELRTEDDAFDKHKEEIDTHLSTQLNELYNDFSKNFDPRNEAERNLHKIRQKEFGRLRNKFMDRRKIEIKYDLKLHEWAKKNKRASYEDLVSFREKNEKEMMEELIKKDLSITAEQVGNELAKLPAPTSWKPVEDFAVEKAAETFSNLAMYAYGLPKREQGEKSPLILVENVFPEWALSRAGTLKQMVEKSKELFVEKLMKERGISKNRAKEIADENLGVTWDVGHINLLRKYGYTEKEITEEAKKIAKHVKHVHLTDNFGYSDSHLSAGMGNVPIKEQLQEIEKQANLKEMRAIIEAGGMIQQFQTSPVPHDIEGLNSPFYAYDHGPSWTDVRDIYSSYLFGYGDILPQQHFRMQGAGFSLLPKELGGQTGGGAGDQDRGRFATESR